MNSGLDLLEQQMRELVCRVTGLPNDFDANAHLYLDLGVASMHALQLLTELEQEYGIHVPDEQFVDATSLAQLTTMVRGLTTNPLQA